MVDYASPRDMTFFDLVSLGRLPGWQVVRLAGNNPDIDILTLPEDIWEPGGLYPFQSTAQILEVLSSDANDTAAGTGARTVLISGLNANWELITELKTMNGITPVVTTQSFLRVNSIRVITAGAGESNLGTITLRVSPGGATLAVIGFLGTQGNGVSFNGIFSVPLGKRVWVTNVTTNIQLEPSGTIQVHFKVRPFGGAWSTTNQFSLHAQGGSFASFTPPVYLFGPEKSDFRATVVTASANNIGVNLNMSGIMGPNVF